MHNASGGIEDVSLRYCAKLSVDDDSDRKQSRRLGTAKLTQCDLFDAHSQLLLPEIPGKLYSLFNQFKKKRSYEFPNIFRKNGNQRLLRSYYSGSARLEEMGPHELASIIKKNIADLKPLSHEIIIERLAIVFGCDCEVTDERIQSIFQRCRITRKEAISRKNIGILGYVMRMLLEVASYSDVNLVGPEALGVIFAPALLGMDEQQVTDEAVQTEVKKVLSVAIGRLILEAPKIGLRRDEPQLWVEKFASEKASKSLMGKIRFHMPTLFAKDRKIDTSNSKIKRRPSRSMEPRLISPRQDVSITKRCHSEPRNELTPRRDSPREENFGIKIRPPKKPRSILPAVTDFCSPSLQESKAAMALRSQLVYVPTPRLPVTIKHQEEVKYPQMPSPNTVPRPPQAVTPKSCRSLRRSPNLWPQTPKRGSDEVRSQRAGRSDFAQEQANCQENICEAKLTTTPTMDTVSASDPIVSPKSPDLLPLQGLDKLFESDSECQGFAEVFPCRTSDFARFENEERSLQSSEHTALILTPTNSHNMESSKSFSSRKTAGYNTINSSGASITADPEAITTDVSKPSSVRFSFSPATASPGTFEEHVKARISVTPLYDSSSSQERNSRQTPQSENQRTSGSEKSQKTPSKFRKWTPPNVISTDVVTPKSRSTKSSTARSLPRRPNTEEYDTFNDIRWRDMLSNSEYATPLKRNGEGGGENDLESNYMMSRADRPSLILLRNRGFVMSMVEAHNRSSHENSFSAGP